MLKITTVNTSSHAVKLCVEGRLTGRSVEELRQACDAYLLDPQVLLTLDLADVLFADAEGFKLLKSLRSRNVILVNPSPFLAIQVGGGDGERFPLIS